MRDEYDRSFHPSHPANPLPFAHGKNFASLDEYLAHLREYAGPVGQPWYRHMGPGRYEVVTTQ